MKKKKITPQQTHVRIFKTDKLKLKKYMKKKKIKSEAKAINTIFNKKKRK